MAKTSLFQQIASSGLKHNSSPMGNFSLPNFIIRIECSQHLLTTPMPSDIYLVNGKKVILADGYPTVKSELENRGFECIVIDMSQIRAADGSLTCCSIFY
jgi:hypothetical protein